MKQISQGQAKDHQKNIQLFTLFLLLDLYISETIIVDNNN